MILNIIFSLIVGLFNFLFSGFAPVTALPWGDEYLSTAMGYFYRLVALVPPLGTVMTVFLIFLGYKLSMIIIKLVLGSRSPHTYA